MQVKHLWLTIRTEILVRTVQINYRKDRFKWTDKLDNLVKSELKGLARNTARFPESCNWTGHD